MPPRSANRGSNSRSRSPSDKCKEKKHKKDKKDKKQSKEERRREAAANNVPASPTSSSDDEHPGPGLALLPSSSSQISTDLLNSVVSTVNSLVSEVQSMNKEMRSFRDELKSQRQEINHMLTTVTKIHTEAEQERAQFRKELDETNESIQAKLADLDRKLARQPTHSPSSVPASAPGPGSSQQPVVGRPSSAKATDDLKLLVMGFPRALPRTALYRYFTKLVNGLSEAHPATGKPECFGSSGTMFSIGFSNRANYITFQKWYREHKETVMYKDISDELALPEDDPKRMISIIIKPPSSSAQRKRGKLLSPYHKFLAANLRNSKLYTPEMKLRTKPETGTVTIENEHHLWTLFHIEETPNGLEVATNVSAAEKHGFSLESIAAFVADASAAAGRKA
jgi:hypothetical protein